MVDRKTFLAMILCLLIYAGWQKFYLDPLMLQQQQAHQIQEAQQAAAARSNPAALAKSSASYSSSSSATLNQGSPQDHIAAQDPAAIRPSESKTLSTETGEVTIGDAGSFFTAWNLKNYKLGIQNDSPAVDLQTVTRESGELSLAFDDPAFAYLTHVQGHLSATDRGILWKYEDKNVKISREFFNTTENPALGLHVKIEFKTARPKFAFVSLAGQTSDDDSEAQDRNFFYWTNQSIERVAIKGSLSQQAVSTPVKYIGTSNRYFIFSAIAEGMTQPNALVQPTTNNAGRISLVYPITENTLSIPLKVYFGPKELDLLNKVEPTLNHTVDFGWFTVFAYPLLNVLKTLYHYVQNYGVAIILLTLLLKILTYPLTYKSMKSMKKMAKLQPQLTRLRERYKDDKEALNREMLTLMKGQGYNPMAGCLPMIIQMPIFFALYRVLYSSIELYHAPFMFWIQDLSLRDPFYVTPVLLSITMYFQQKLTPNTSTDPAQQKMMQFMPVIFGAFMLALPAGLTIYMLINAIASIGQQFILNKKLDGATT